MLIKLTEATMEKLKKEEKMLIEISLKEDKKWEKCFYLLHGEILSFLGDLDMLQRTSTSDPILCGRLHEIESHFRNVLKRVEEIK